MKTFESSKITQTETEIPEAPPNPLGYEHLILRAKVLQYQQIERMLVSLGHQRRSLAEDFPAIILVTIDEALERLKPLRNPIKSEIRKIVKGSVLDDWIRGTHGLKHGLWLLLGSMPPVTEFKGPASIWKYVGLDVRGGAAPRPKDGERLGFAPYRRAYAIKRVADPIVKVGGPYRAVYDARRERTLLSHPPMCDAEGDLMFPECETCREALRMTREHREEKSYTRERKAPSFDCSAAGGIHWTDGHRHADALRVTAKAVLKDAWRVGRGLAPRIGGAE